MCNMVTVGLTVFEKRPGQTNKQTNPRTNRQERKDYSRRATITREPLSKGDSRTGLNAFHIQLPKM